MPRVKQRRRGRPSQIARYSLADITQELDRRRNDLHARRDELANEIAELDSQISELGAGGSNGTPVPSRKRGPRTGGRRGRGSNEQSLASVLQSVLRGKTMNVADMAEAAVKAGYKSSSKNFKTVIGLTLLKHKKLYRRVSRGQYTAK